MADSTEVEPPIPLVLLPCASCNRTFRPEALAKHTKVCEKTLMKKRKKFDSSKQRLHGTDVPNFPPPPKQKESPLKPIPQSSKWREKQVELTKTLNSMRKKSDGNLPVKPSDHEQCHYCERFFGPKAYDRHTEWCKEQHIKLKNSNNMNNEARERLQVRTKYRAPLSNRVLTRDKYLPRSRDPSPMNSSRVEAEDPEKHKLPSPLNRTSSLRMSGRSKSMITKSPIVVPIETKDVKPRSHVSSTSVRMKNEKPQKAAEREQMIINTDHVKPKIVTSSQTPKKVAGQVKEKDQLVLRKCKSWTETFPEEENEQEGEQEKIEELKVYACVLHPLSQKRSFESSLSQANGRKRSTSVSRSNDTLPRTYIIGKTIAEHPEPELEALEEVVDTDKQNCSYPERSNDYSEDQTSEMISDNIYQHGDVDTVRKLLPFTCTKLEVEPLQKETIRPSPLLAIEYRPTEETAIHAKQVPIFFREWPDIREEEEEQIKAVEEEIPSNCSNEWPAFFKNEFHEVWEQEINAAGDDFMHWCTIGQYKDVQGNLQQQSEESFSFEENPNPILNEFHTYMEKSAVSEDHSIFDHFHRTPFQSFRRVEDVIEIKDASTTVDDFDDYLARQLENDRVEGEAVNNAPCYSKEVQTLPGHFQMLDTECLSIIDHPIGELHSLNAKHARSDSCLLKSCVEFESENMFMVGSDGSLQSLPHSERDLGSKFDCKQDEDEFSQNVIGPRYSEINQVLDGDSGLCTSEDRFAHEDNHKESEDPALLANLDTLKIPCLNESSSLNEMIGFLIGAKMPPNLMNLINVATINNLNSYATQTNNFHDSIKNDTQFNLPKTPVLCCHRSIQADLPCVKCEEYEFEKATAIVNQRSDASSQTSNLDYWGKRDHVLTKKNSEFNIFSSNKFTAVQPSKEFLVDVSGDSVSLDASSDLDDDTSEWDISASTCSLCSQESPISYKNDCRNVLRKKTVKYYETIEYKSTDEGASTVKTTVKQLPPLKNPPKYLIAKTVKKEIRPISPERRALKQENCFAKITGECVKLPPIKRRYERHPCLTRASGDGDAVSAESSKFCHECGTKYPIPKAKFCCNCGIRRLAV